MSKIYVFVPAYNEEEKIIETLTSIREAFSSATVVVVDDGSQDNTVELVLGAGESVICTNSNIGKGRALKKAIYDDFENKFSQDDIVILADADIGRTADELSKLVYPLSEGKADMAIAVFPPALKKGGFGLVKKLARSAILKSCGMEVSSPISGQRAIKASLLPTIKKAFEYGYGLEVAMTLLACKSGARIVEVKTNMRHRETGRDLRGFLHRGRQFLDILRVLADLKIGRA